MIILTDEEFAKEVFYLGEEFKEAKNIPGLEGLKEIVKLQGKNEILTKILERYRKENAINNG